MLLMEQKLKEMQAKLDLETAMRTRLEVYCRRRGGGSSVEMDTEEGQSGGMDKQIIDFLCSKRLQYCLCVMNLFNHVFVQPRSIGRK